MQRNHAGVEQRKGQSKRLTIRDIAQLAGVSKSTVSRVLNHSDHLDEETRQRVLQVMEEHGFVASANARGLNGRSRLIGMVVPDLSWTLIAAVSKGISRSARERDYEILVYGGSHEDDYHTIADRIVKTNLVAGLVAVVFRGSAEHMETLYHEGLPLVMVDIIGINADMPLVRADNERGMFSATRHLLELGHTRIGYIQGPLEFLCTHERYRGFCLALEQAGIPLDPSLILQGDFNPTGGQACAERFFAMSEPPTAIIGSNDLSAFGALEVARERNIKVPEEVSFVGFDDEPQLVHGYPSLTTVHQPFFEMGQCAAELLLSRLEPGQGFADHWRKHITAYNDDDQPYRIQLPTYLVIGQTTGPVR